MFKSIGECRRVPKDKEDGSSSSITFGCGLCDEGGWCSETEIVIHKRSKHARQIDNIFRNNLTTACMGCTNTFVDRQTLVSHYKNDHLYTSSNAKRIARQIFVCDYCQQIFFNKGLLELHISFKHMHSSMLQCPLCFKEIKLRGVWRHMESHEMHSVSVCPICLIKCKNIFALRKHIESHPKYYHCDICGFESNREINFHQHIKRYQEAKDVSENDYKDLDVTRCCLVPNNNISWWQAMRCYGTKGMVLSNKMYICVLCRHISTKMMAIKKHVYLAHIRFVPAAPVKRTKYTCFCGEEFDTNIMLKQHVFKLKEPHRAMSSNTARVKDNRAEFKEDFHELQTIESMAKKIVELIGPDTPTDPTVAEQS